MTEENTPGKSLYALKFTVISLGVVLLGGIILLFALLYQRHNKVQPVVTASPMAEQCTNENGTVTVKGKVTAIEQDGNHITLLSTTEQGRQELTILDSCSGKVIQTFSVVVE